MEDLLLVPIHKNKVSNWICIGYPEVAYLIIKSRFLGFFPIKIKLAVIPPVKISMEEFDRIKKESEEEIKDLLG